MVGVDRLWFYTSVFLVNPSLIEPRMGGTYIYIYIIYNIPSHGLRHWVYHIIIGSIFGLTPSISNYLSILHHITMSFLQYIVYIYNLYKLF